MIEIHLKGFYQKNELENVLLLEWIGKGFTIKMHWKGFYNKNTFERVLL